MTNKKIHSSLIWDHETFYLKKLTSGGYQKSYFDEVFLLKTSAKALGCCGTNRARIVCVTSFKVAKASGYSTQGILTDGEGSVRLTS